jgi:hypothetical protein
MNVYEHRKRNTASLITALLLICTGVFLIIVLIGFKPETSPHFSDTAGEQPLHFLGWTGIRIASTCFILLGKASVYFAIMLCYAGYVMLRHIRPLGKAGLILLAAVSIPIMCGLLYPSHPETLHTGGGLFGRYSATRLAPPLGDWLLRLYFALPLIAVLFVLFNKPIRALYEYLFGGEGDSEAAHTDGNDTQRRDRNTGERERGLFRRPSRSGKERIKREKLPLISKVYISGEDQQTSKSPVRENVHLQSRGKKVGVSTRKEASRPLQKKASSDAVGASSFLRKSNPVNKREQERETERKALELERTLKEFGIDAKVTGIIMGPVITRYELQPAPGVKLSRIENLSNNIALNLSANGVRIEAPIPGRAAVGIEIPNDEREIVTLGDILESAVKKGELPLVLGKDISGGTVVSDLCSMPHLLIAGATGSGKSVCVNSLIMSMISQKSPEQVRLLMIDPKMVELKIYNGIPHLLTEVVTDPRDAAKALRWVIFEMENRYRLLDENYVRNISSYNRKMREPLPYIVIIVDEFANLMAISQKEVEDAVVRLAAMSRAVGIHLIMATQRPSVDVITGLIKANFPFRIAFQVASKMDSRTILDTIGAEKLLGSGDMLFAPAGSMNIQRIQGAFISEEEVVGVVRELKKKAQPEYVEDMFSISHSEGPAVDFEDPLLDQAIEIVLNTKRASASFLQRRLKIGYNRSARLIELMEEKGIIGPPRGSKPREIYIDRID